MMNRTSAPPRGPRNSSSSTRGGGRVGGGGITKRRAGPIRVDKDGDLDMDTTTGANGRKGGKGAIGGSVPTGPRGHGRGGARNTGRGGGRLDVTRNPQAILRGMGSQSQQANVLVTLWIKGLKGSKAASNSDQGLSSLVSFLERKATALDSKSKRSIRVKKSHKKGDVVVISVAPEDAASIMKLDGFAFAGSTIGVQDSEPSKTSEKAESEEARLTREKIQGVLAARYDPNLKLLNLSALGQDEQLKQMGMFEDNTLVSKLFPVLMVICDKLFTTPQAKKDAIVSVTLTDNSLADLSNVTSLASTFPDLKNLDLSRNQFADLESLKLWRWKFRHLENLVLSGNPIETLVPDYATDIVRWFPELQQLSGVQVRSVAQVHADLEAIKSPFPIASPSFRDVAQVGENFVRQFFGAYDNDRNALLTNFYDAESSFSLSVNMSAVRDRDHSLPVPPWAAYNKFNRNLVKYTHLSTRLSRKSTGSQEIQATWNDLPKTIHPEIATRPELYLVECQPLPGLPDPSGQSAAGVDGLLIDVHGEFEENIPNFEGKALRSFSRYFILGPGGPNGPPIRVLSDMLALRAWSPLAQTTAVQGPQPVPVLPNVPQVPIVDASLTPEQQQKICAEKLSAETGMNLQYSAMCLAETGWNLEQAYIAFQANKANLPAEAYQKP
ncbi:putative mrna export factor mex67 protein [Botrytis fragariae]|uniref:mRNA export factor MEX67 n=1 Tax=Botrytis fragariae TaxID=1964551 RepID=A0A8H6AXL6_9HELO|nr:putative mrna export factor mex67 protein [Botrytis fragariae]KAF5875407.1 putative mrna export factor mex67 protein [Botrytis fragariae]